MFEFFKKRIKREKIEGYIYCPYCGKGFSSFSQKPFYCVADHRDLNIFKCKKCGDLFLVEKKIYYDPSLYISYRSSKIIENYDEEKNDCIGQYLFDFYDPM